MPHDAKGNLLQLNDRVMIPGVIKNLQAGDEYCNCTVETIYEMHPGNNKIAITLNTKQVEKKE